jgi:hypothetical protein
MKLSFYCLLLSVFLVRCTYKENEKTYLPDVIQSNRTFNGYADEQDSTLTFTAHKDKSGTAVGANPKIWYQVKFGDTVVKVQTNPADPASGNKKFIRGQFLNTQKTTLLAQIADSTGLAAKFYLIALKDHALQVTELSRPSTSQSNKALLGLIEVGRSGYVVNNDFFVSYVNPKVYYLKRPNPDERINGQFFLKSPDSQTVIFLMPNSELYQVSYATNEVYSVPLGMDASKQGIYDFAEQNFTWIKNDRGVQFLMPNNPKVIGL